MPGSKGVDPTVAHPTRQFGSAGIGTVYGPRIFSYDTKLDKTCAIRERYKLKFGVQAFNLFNHPLLGNPDTEQTSSTFGRIRTSQVSGDSSATPYTPRSLQLVVRVEF
jgi:hypothetical protein